MRNAGTEAVVCGGALVLRCAAMKLMPRSRSSALLEHVVSDEQIGYSDEQQYPASPCESQQML